MGDVIKFRRLRMRHSRAALIAFDANAGAREAALDRCQTDADVEAFIREEKAAEDRVREAFWHDTADRNSRDNCMLVSLAFVRKLCREFGP